MTLYVKKDALNSVNDTYGDFQNVLLTNQRSNETFQNFESRFSAAITKMKSHGSVTLPESLAAFMLLGNSNIGTTQRISILSAAISHSQNSESTNSDEEIMDSVKYDSIASILRQCDISKSSSIDTLRLNSDAIPRHRWSRNQRTPQQIAELQNNSRFKT